MAEKQTAPINSKIVHSRVANRDLGLFQYKFLSIVSATLVFTSAGLARRLLRLAFLEPIRWPAPARFLFILPVAVTFTLLLKPLWDFCLGIGVFLEINFAKT
jgi:hypothetical protein